MAEREKNGNLNIYVRGIDRRKYGILKMYATIKKKTLNDVVREPIEEAADRAEAEMNETEGKE